MTTVSHPPGPWRHDRRAILAPGCRCVAEVFSGACATLEEADANGRLLAAAPLLLRAAQHALIELTSTVAAQDPAAMRALIVSYLREAIDSATTTTTAESPPGA